LSIVQALLPSPVTVAIGCAGGRHRSVVLADVLAEHLALAGWHVQTNHLHVDKPVVVRS
jgi:UPF0042 nucleotide-binding protein